MGVEGGLKEKKRTEGSEIETRFHLSAAAGDCDLSGLEANYELDKSE